MVLCLVKRCPAVCNVNHFVIMLGAYGATLSIKGTLLSLSAVDREAVKGRGVNRGTVPA